MHLHHTGCDEACEEDWDYRDIDEPERFVPLTFDEPPMPPTEEIR